MTGPDLAAFVLARVNEDAVRDHADVEARRQLNRQIVADSRTADSRWGPHDDYEGIEHSAYQQVLRLLALRYADHPDYQQEWKP